MSGEGQSQHTTAVRRAVRLTLAPNSACSATRIFGPLAGSASRRTFHCPAGELTMKASTSAHARPARSAQSPHLLRAERAMGSEENTA